MTRKVRVAFLLLLSFVLILTAACSRPQNSSSTSPAPESGQTSQPADEKLAPLNPPVKIWIAEDGSATGAGFYIGAARGYYKELGIEVDIRPFESSSDMLPAIASGEVDVAGGIAGANLFNAVARGLDIRVIGDKGTNFTDKSFFRFVVRKGLENEIKDYKDLKGRKIGLFSLGTINEYIVGKALEAGGLTTADVELIPMGPPDMNVALTTGAIDVGLQIEPLIAKGEQDGILVRWKDTEAFAPGTQIAVVLASPKFVENRELAKRFMVAYLHGLRDYNDAFFHGKDKDAVIKIMTEYTDLKDPAAWESVHVARLDANGQVFGDDLVAQYEWYRKAGAVEAEVDVSKMIDTELAQFAVDYLGGPYGN